MKKVIFIIIAVFTINICFAKNKIDSLRTKEEVNKFLAEKIDSSYWSYSIFCSGCRTDSFYIVDINSDGSNDLIIDASRALVILDKGSGKYGSLNISANRYNGAIKLGDLTALVYYDSLWRYNEVEGIGWIDTIVYKYGMLFVYHANKHEHKINKLYYHAKDNYGCPSCLTFNIEIHEDGTSFLEFEGDDKINGRINEGLLNAINDEINALEFDTLSDQSNMDAGYSQAQLEIWYDDGKHKKIRDEEMESSLRLSGICEMFHGLLYMDLWKPIRK